MASPPMSGSLLPCPLHLGLTLTPSLHRRTAVALSHCQPLPQCASVSLPPAISPPCSVPLLPPLPLLCLPPSHHPRMSQSTKELEDLDSNLREAIDSVQSQLTAEMVQAMTTKCFKHCITEPAEFLSSKEERCLQVHSTAAREHSHPDGIVSDPAVLQYTAALCVPIADFPLCLCLADRPAMTSSSAPVN